MHDSLSESGSSQTLFASRASEFSYPDSLATLGYCHVVTSRVPPVIWKWALSFTQDKGSQMLLDTVQAEGPGPCFANMLPHLGICFGLCLGWEADRFISFINTGKIKASQRLIFRLKAFFLGQGVGGCVLFCFQVLCLLFYGQCSQTCCRFFITHSRGIRREATGATETEQSGKKFWKRSGSHKGEESWGRLCWLTRDGKSLNHNRPCLYWHALTEVNSWAKLLISSRCYLQSRQLWWDFTGLRQSQEVVSLSPATEVLQWANTSVRLLLLWKAHPPALLSDPDIWGSESALDSLLWSQACNWAACLCRCWATYGCRFVTRPEKHQTRMYRVVLFLKADINWTRTLRQTPC